MTIKELKVLLNKYPDNLPVYVHDMEGDFSKVIDVHKFDKDPTLDGDYVPLEYIFLESENEAYVGLARR